MPCQYWYFGHRGLFDEVVSMESCSKVEKRTLVLLRIIHTTIRTP